MPLVAVLVAGAMLWPLTAVFLDTYTDTDVAWWDAFPTAFSVIGQCLLYRDHRPIGRLLVGEDEFVEYFDSARVADHITRFCLAGMKPAARAPDAQLARAAP